MLPRPQTYLVIVSSLPLWVRFHLCYPALRLIRLLLPVCRSGYVSRFLKRSQTLNAGSFVVREPRLGGTQHHWKGLDARSQDKTPRGARALASTD